jgi:hypothetical protein
MGFQKTLVVWWRFGKEHGGDDFRINSLETISTHLDSKAAAFKAKHADDWRWWQVDDELLIERHDPDRLFGPTARIYYLINRGLGVAEGINLPPPDDGWKWYIHLADHYFDSARGCWLMKDLFVDILVGGDDRQSRVIDLDEFAQALDIGLIDSTQASAILRRTDSTLTAIAKGQFPFPEIARGQLASQQLGWRQ